jgi:hypothetical protein
MNLNGVKLNIATCPVCNFYGQIYTDIEEYGDGMYYDFVCEECNIAATHYQQS